MSGWQGRRLHFIGIGGAGMSGLAAVCAARGAEVAGSDRAASGYTERLAGQGVKVAIGHDRANLDRDAEVVVSTAIDEDNPELKAAREMGLTVRRRGELLAELCAEKRLIAVAGTHGKTTTTAMIAWALREMGTDPAWFVGGEVRVGGDTANAGWGTGEWVVAEADESDASFLELSPEVALITNIELDHHSRWATGAQLRDAFAEFAGRARSVTVGPDVDLGLGEATFGAGHPGPDTLDLKIPGAHNRLNARACLSAIELSGEDPDRAADALRDFPGVARRLEYKGTRDGARVYDDYAHHPTEVAAALSALRELEPDRLIAVFQPHLYSRTRVMAAEFGAALAAADEVAVLDVYPAREEPVGELAGVSGLQVAEAVADRCHGRAVWWVRDADGAESALAGRLGDGDILVTLGAGDITRLSDRLVEVER